MTLLSRTEIQEKLKQINGWNLNENAIELEVVRNDFADALCFVVKVGIEAEKNDHHPDIFIHSWNKVKITLSTHSLGGVTEKDFNLASIISLL